MKKPLGNTGEPVWIIYGDGSYQKKTFRRLVSSGGKPRVLICDPDENPRLVECDAFPFDQVFHIEDYAGVRNYINAIVNRAAGALASFNQEIRGELTPKSRNPEPQPESEPDAIRVNQGSRAGETVAAPVELQQPEPLEFFHIEKIDLVEMSFAYAYVVNVELPAGAKVLNVATADGFGKPKIQLVCSYHSRSGSLREAERAKFWVLPYGKQKLNASVETPCGGEYVGSVTVALDRNGLQKWEDFHVFRGN